MSVIEFPEEHQEWDARLFELLMEAIPKGREDAVFTATTVSVEDLRRAVVDYRIPDMPTWVVPPGVYVEPSIPVNVVESPLVGPDHFVVVPPDAFGSHPLDG